MAVRPLMILPPVIFAGLAGLFLGAMWGGDGDELPSALIGQPAPQVAVGELGGRSFDPAVMADGELKLVNFWASWCAPCRVEHPNLSLLAEEGVPIYGINYKDQPQAAQDFLAELGDPYAAVGTDASGRVAVEWGVYGVPETFLVDGDGTVLLRMAGPVLPSTMESRLIPAIKAARAE
ncbi:DsbE family thiol:disulfide interchange protein [Wenxinia saemankumensis]|uniref:Cytochrome c biogenesis protein CcmG, thiol:disulfide interchange protein DsbE n=1 Tax=Wenxinia saemankumensis TaxID=1447782 RepID=A0A1M6EXA0_9RHOB|nr:DsbE family thiol:disulfide interchange protein [Wenxinia saemankumensis]SHI90062.1 cytochrome c biogenesis protein CcmG, thiol:disulfide interchange protein DsbE [Wenxinia saemankumensis]